MFGLWRTAISGANRFLRDRGNQADSTVSSLDALAGLPDETAATQRNFNGGFDEQRLDQANRDECGQAYLISAACRQRYNGAPGAIVWRRPPLANHCEQSRWQIHDRDAGIEFAGLAGG